MDELGMRVHRVQGSIDHVHWKTKSAVLEDLADQSIEAIINGNT